MRKLDARLAVTLLITIYAFVMLFGGIRYPFNFLDDRRYYIPAAKRLLEGASPATVNPEHPPLAKYLIGLSYIATGDYTLLSKLLGVLSLILVYKIGDVLFTDKRIPILALIFLSSDTLYLYTFTTALLDVYSTFFILLATYLILRYVNGGGEANLVAGGLATGLSLASKWTPMPVAAALLLLPTLKGKSIKRLLEPLTAAALVYVASYLKFFLDGHGLGEFMVLQLAMLKYHSVFHSPTYQLTTISLSYLFLKLTAFPTYSFGTITLTPYTHMTLTAHYVGRAITVYLTDGSLTWYLFLPSLLYTSYRTLTGTASKNESTLLLLTLAALVMPLISIIRWYYVLALPYLYHMTSLLAEEKMSRHAALFPIVAYISTVLAIFGLHIYVRVVIT